MTKSNVLIRFFALLLIISLVPACGNLEDCKTCSKVTYDNSGELSRTPGVPYCDEELAEKESTPPVTVLGVTTVWECN